MLRTAALFILLATMLSACGGRNPADIYRAYNLTSGVGSNGKSAAGDLAAQNRYTLQTSGEYQYLYVAPEQQDFQNPDPNAQADKHTDESSVDESESDESADETTEESGEEEFAEDESLPDDVSSADLESRIDDIQEELENLAD